LPEGQFDAVLVANTYHELMHPRAVLKAVLRALHPGAGLSSSIEVLCRVRQNPVHPKRSIRGLPIRRRRRLSEERNA
jgi:hypothetical protein